MLIRELNKKEAAQIERARSLDALDDASKASMGVAPARTNFLEACHRLIGRDDIAGAPSYFTNQYSAWLEYDIAPRRDR